MKHDDSLSWFRGACDSKGMTAPPAEEFDGVPVVEDPAEVPNTPIRGGGWSGIERVELTGKKIMDLRANLIDDSELRRPGGISRKFAIRVGASVTGSILVLTLLIGWLKHMNLKQGLKSAREEWVVKEPSGIVGKRSELKETMTEPQQVVQLA